MCNLTTLFAYRQTVLKQKFEVDVILTITLNRFNALLEGQRKPTVACLAKGLACLMPYLRHLIP